MNAWMPHSREGDVRIYSEAEMRRILGTWFSDVFWRRVGQTACVAVARKGPDHPVCVREAWNTERASLSHKPLHGGYLTNKATMNASIAANMSAQSITPRSPPRWSLPATAWCDSRSAAPYIAHGDRASAKALFRQAYLSVIDYYRSNSFC